LINLLFPALLDGKEGKTKETPDGRHLLHMDSSNAEYRSWISVDEDDLLDFIYMPDFYYRLFHLFNQHFTF